MTRSLPPSRRSALRRRLLAWFDRAKRDLPWRSPQGDADPYRVWISEAMLQQTRVATVIPYYRRFLRRFPTLRSLAEGTEEEVLALWSGLGYYARGRALLRAAREARSLHGGLPRDVAALRALPGFGPYTAGAVASIAFGLAEPAVDGNAGRVLARLLLLRGDPRGGRFRGRVWSVARQLVTGSRRPGDLNQSLIELGALVCRPSSPRCDRCPVESLCEARREGLEGSIPAVRRRPVVRPLTLAVGVVWRRDRVLLGKRPTTGLFAGMWGPPTVEVAAGEDPASVISSAIRREPSVKTGEFTLAGTVVRTLTHRRLELRVCVADGGPLPSRPRASGGWRFARRREISGLGIPSALRAALTLAGDYSRKYLTRKGSFV